MGRCGMHGIYDTALWRIVRRRVLARDGNACTVSRLLGGDCHGTLHVHHLIPVSEGGARFDDANLITACASHHPQLEAVRRHVLARRFARESMPRCNHEHRTAEARAICERRMARTAA